MRWGLQRLAAAAQGSMLREAASPRTGIACRIHLQVCRSGDRERRPPPRPRRRLPGLGRRQRGRQRRWGAGEWLLRFCAWQLILRAETLTPRILQDAIPSGKDPREIIAEFRVSMIDS